MEGEITESLRTLIDGAFEHAFGSIAEEGGPLIPFLMTQRRGRVRLTRFVSGASEGTLDLGESVEAARQAARDLSGKADRAVVVFDGYVTMDDGQKYDCFYAEAYEGGTPGSFMLFQRYRPASEGEEFVFLNDPEVCAKSGPLW